jgi:16S rRNA A1518/A1519 N6-dimethyltransferase RsmA/KsgA/DIM1 with predicted DNA glycosylase/AP lyase activity
MRRECSSSNYSAADAASVVQEGAARRLTEARVGDKDYRAVSVFTQYFATARSCFGVSRSTPSTPLHACMRKAVGTSRVWEHEGCGLWSSLFRDLFYPAPHVDSALAEFVLRPHRGELDAAQEAQFLAFVTQAFGMKRKTLVNNLKGRWDQRALQECMESSAIPTMSRAESLSVQDFIELFKCVRALAPTTV